MLKNVGSPDRIIRVLLGAGLIITGLVLQSWWGLVGIIPLATAGLSFCPLYSIVGLSTCKTAK
jgi:hypothetical protein